MDSTSKGGASPPCHAIKCSDGVYLAGGIARGGGGAGGLAKLPDCRRANSSWFNWAAVVPLIADGGCFAFPTWCVETWRAGLCIGGVAESVAPIDPGGIAAPGCDQLGGTGLL
jgi:hypothetical protein